jgi:hypothetical protein
LIPAAGKTGKMGRKCVKLCNVVVVKAQFFQSRGESRKRGQMIADAYQLCQGGRKRGKRTDMIV